MGEVVTTIPVKQVELSAVVIRADGRVEDLGIIASSKPKKRLFRRNRG